MKTGNYKAFIVFTILVSLVCAVAWGFLAYKSFSLRSDIVALGAEAESAAARNDKTLSLKAAFRDSRQSVAAIDARFVTKDGIPDFIDLIEAKAKESGVKVELDSVNLDKSLRLHLAGTGSWKASVGYVSLLESLPYAITLDNLSLSKAVGQGNAWSMSLDLYASVDPSTLSNANATNL